MPVQSSWSHLPPTQCTWTHLFLACHLYNLHGTSAGEQHVSCLLSCWNSFVCSLAVRCFRLGIELPPILFVVYQLDASWGC